MSGDGRPPRPAEFGGGGADPSGGADHPDAGPDPDGGGSTSLTARVTSGLLETEPADEPARERDNSLEYARIGLKKFLNGLLDSGIGPGRTAAEDFGLAALASIDGGDGGDGGGDDDDLGGDGFAGPDMPAGSET
jgi:hypothetical protein